MLAHAQLVASSPGAGEILPEAPTELRLVFSEPLEDEVTSLDLTALDGTVILERAGEVDPDDPYALVAEPPVLEDGTYTVTWRSLSAADGHVAEGFLTFGVGEFEGACRRRPATTRTGRRTSPASSAAGSPTWGSWPPWAWQRSPSWSCASPRRLDRWSSCCCGPRAGGGGDR